MLFPTRKRLLVTGLSLAALGVVLPAASGTAATVGVPRPQATQITGSTSSGALLQVLNTNSGGAIIGQVGASQIAAAAGAGLYGVFNPSSGAGEGILGFASNGTGVVAETFGGVYAAVYAQNYSAAAAPAMQAVSNGNSVVGTSANSNSIVGITNDPTHGSATAAGVLGEDGTSASYVSNNDGVLGTTLSGDWGVEGTSSDQALGGVSGYATTGTGVYGTASGQNAGVYGYNSSSTNDTGTGSGTSSGTSGHSIGGPGVYGYSTNWYGGLIENDSAVSTFEVVTDTGSGNPIILYNKNTSSFPFYVSASGSVTSAGYIMSKGGGTLARTRNPNSDLVTYGAQQTESTVEDFGSAQLVNGAAAVALRPDFAQTIDMASSYMVFITPDGENNGLYVTGKSANGFVVRESHGGRSTLAFDYRIVAHPFGQRVARLPHFATMMASDARPDGTTGVARRLEANEAHLSHGGLGRAFAVNHIPAGAPPSAVQLSRGFRVR